MRHAVQILYLGNTFTPSYQEWFSPFLEQEQTIEVCRGEKIVAQKEKVSG